MSALCGEDAAWQGSEVQNQRGGADHIPQGGIACKRHAHSFRYARGTQRTWSPRLGGRVSIVPIGSDCDDACVRVNTGNCSLHAFAKCRLSCIVDVVGRLKEHVHGRINIDMSC